MARTDQRSLELEELADQLESFSEPYVSLEEHFLQAYVATVHGCVLIKSKVPVGKSKHALMPVLGVAFKPAQVVGCDILDWLDAGWPKEMNPSKVIAKVRERGDLFRDRMELRYPGVGRRYMLFAFHPLSKRVKNALPSIMAMDVGSAVGVVEGDLLNLAVEKVVKRISDVDFGPGNHFIETVELLRSAGQLRAKGKGADEDPR